MPIKATPKPKPGKSLQKDKKPKKIINWSKYNDDLVRRGSIEFWIEQGAKVNIKIIKDDIKKKRGAPLTYSNGIIEFVLLLGTVFHQRLRQTEGFAESVISMMKVGWDVPDFTTLCRRRRNVPMNLSLKSKEGVVAIMDSTGLKVYGEGEWKVRKHGYGKHRTWLKLHISIDSDGELRVIKLTGNNIDDATAGRDMLLTEKVEITKIVGDGGYDKRMIYDMVKNESSIQAIIPPQKNAKIMVHGNTKGLPHPRDKNLRDIRKSTRKQWKIASGYHIRSRAETTMFRFKTIFTDKVHSRSFESQKREVFLKCQALNIMANNGLPKYETL